MNELPSHFVAQEPADPDSTSEKLLNPELAQAQVLTQTIQRFRALNQEITKIHDRNEQEYVREKLYALATQEYGKAWEVLKQPGVEVAPLFVRGKTGAQYLEELQGNNCGFSSSAQRMLEQPEFQTSVDPQALLTVRVNVETLFPRVSDQSFGPARSVFFDIVTGLGLELCSPYVGPEYLLAYSDKLDRDGVSVGMEPIRGFGRKMGVFHITDLGLGFDRVGDATVCLYESDFLFLLPVNTK